jgi:allene oxide cyclase-like protein
MPRKFTLGGLTAVAVVVAGTALAAVPANDSRAPKVRTYTSKLVQYTPIETTVGPGARPPLPPGALNPGDEDVFYEALYKHGHRVGHVHAVCTIIKTTTHPGVEQCVVTFSLPKGDITVQGLIPEPPPGKNPPFVQAITGGTGAYSTAHGAVRITPLSETRTRYRLVIR